MTDPVVPEAEEELVDYEEEEAGADDKKAIAGAAGAAAGGAAAAGKGAGYVGIHSSGFKDFLLKPELLRAIVDCGFEHPSEGKKKKGREKEDGRRCIGGGAVLFSRPPRGLLCPSPTLGARFRPHALPLKVHSFVSGADAASSSLPLDGKGHAQGASCPIAGAIG